MEIIKLKKLSRELALIAASFVLVMLFFNFAKLLPYKYNPFYYLNNILFIEQSAENSQLAVTIFGKTGIRYRDDIVDNGVIFFGQLHRDDDLTETGEIVKLSNLIDIKTFNILQLKDDCSICTYFEDKKYYYKVLEMSDGITLHIYENKSSHGHG